MNKYLLLLFFFYTISGFSQSCNCIKDFEFVVNKIEKKHPGFKLNVNSKNKNQYLNWKKSIRKNIKDSVSNENDCIKYLNKYLSFIKDKHLKIYSPKNVNEKAYAKKILTKKTPVFSEIKNIIYIKVPSFNYRLWKKLDVFYDSITPYVKAREKVILDIRNNSGGGERMYNQLLKLIKKKKIAVLFNKKCASACEEVALKIKSYKNSIAIGQNTNGQFAYGFIKGYKTPNCNFTFITTTKKYRKRLKYEYVGVSPDIKASKEVDWIQLAVEKLTN